jgi:hypothetical protein
MTAMGQGVPAFFVSQGNNYWILQTLLEILNQLPAKPYVVSISCKCLYLYLYLYLYLINHSSFFIASINITTDGWAELEQCDIAIANCDKLGYNSKKYVDATNQAFQQLGYY